MDVCASYLKVNELSDNIEYKPKVSNDIYQIFSEIKENNKKIDLFLKKIKNSNQIFVNFEDIIANDDNIMKQLNNFTGLNMTECIDNFNKKIYYDEPEITMAWKGKTKEKIDASYVNVYKFHKNFQEIEKIYKIYF
jgi:hypothetical protein